MNIEESQKQNDIYRLTKTFDRLKPYSGVLSDDEILKYAPDSRAAAEIRLSRGENNLKDKSLVNGITGWKIVGILFFILFLLLISIALNIHSLAYISAIMAIFAISLSIIYIIYILFIKKYNVTSNETIESPKKIITKKAQPFETNPKLKEVEDLKDTYYYKEQIARDLVEKRFTPPQITYDKFISVIDKSTSVFNNEYEKTKELINLNTTERIDNEIDKKIDILKSLIQKMEGLSKELILTDNSNEKAVIGELDELISSIKDY